MRRRIARWDGMPLSLRCYLACGVVACLAVVSCAGQAAGRAYAMQPAAPAPSAPAPTIAGSPSAVQIPEQLMIEGALTVEVTEVGDLISALRTVVEAAGGRIIEEAVSGGETSWSAHVKVRLPPAQVEPTVAWLAGRGEILSKRIDATDVSRTLFDQELALGNLQATSARLQKLLDERGLQMKDILEIERELTRIRGEIESIKGARRFLEDRVALATLEVHLSRRDGAVTVARAKLYPIARATTLVLLDADGRKRARFGAGVGFHALLRSTSTEIEIYEAEPAAAGADAKPAVIATFGGATYSDFLGRGKRRALNPFLGLRLGYAYLDGSRFVVQGELGLELYKHRRFLIDTSLRATGLIGERNDAALVGGIGVVVAY